jgi:DNA mismatch repair protein MutS2
MNEKLIKTLDFDKITKYFKEHFKYTVTEDLYTLFLFESGRELKENLKITEEFFKYPIDEDKFNFLKKSDIRIHLKYIDKGLLINPEDFIEIASMSDDFRKFSIYIDGLKEGEYSALKKKISILSRDIPQCDKDIYKIIDKNGVVKSTASLKLLEIRKRIKSYEENIRNTLKEYLNSRDLNKYLQEDFYTIRKERFVLPIKSSFRGTIKGIIHDRSNTGETVFIEPEEVLDSNNKLILEKKKEEEEVKRILKELLQLLKPYIPVLSELIETYVQIDLLFSRFKFSRRLGALPITLSSDFRINLISVYNLLSNKQYIAYLLYLHT